MRCRPPRAVVLSAICLAVACAQPEPEPEPLRPVRSERVTRGHVGRSRTFSGTSRAVREIDLSFRVSGNVEHVDVQVGDTVAEGRVLAQLERTDYEIAVRENQAGLDSALARWRNADSGLERIRGLYENNNASQNELDQAVSLAQAALASVESARQELARAERRLGYTTLRAPVDGAIATVPVELNENVVPGETVIRMTSGSVPEVSISIPGVLITRIHRNDPVRVTFPALPRENFDGAVTEVGVAATGAATTFPVTVRLNRESAGIRSGMAADVTFLFGRDSDEERLHLPAHAVGEDAAGRFVFLLESTDQPGVGRVRRTAVEIVSDLTPDGSLEIVSGVSEGQRVVTAGVRRLTNEQRVRLLDPEQDR
jgi:RND family efflux transporter MFP subunit